MKRIKEFESTQELYAVTEELEENDISYVVEGLALYVHVGNIVKVRDIILDTLKTVRKG